MESVTLSSFQVTLASDGSFILNVHYNGATPDVFTFQKASKLKKFLKTELYPAFTNEIQETLSSSEGEVDKE